MSHNNDPFAAPPPTEVALRDAPLVRVIAQVRFPLIVSIEKRDFIGPFQEAIREAYPTLREEQSQGLLIGPQGVAPAQPQVAWRFNEPEGDWRVSLTPAFVALETTDYLSRDDFLKRLGVVLAALNEHISPKSVDRLGVRYIDRVTGDAVGDISRLVRPEVLGVVASPIGVHARHSVSETVFDLPDQAGQMLARWGRLPSGATVDPATIESVEEPSWLLDIDTFSTETRPFDVGGVVGLARNYAERAYALFRWAVTDDFLRRYGGQP